MVPEDEGLHVLAAAAPCRRVAHMADGHTTVERRKVVAVEDLGHQPLALDRREAALLGTDDAARLLAAVLQGMKAVVDDSRRIVHAEDAKDAALLVQGVERQFIHIVIPPVLVNPKAKTGAGTHPRRVAPLFFQSLQTG